MKLATLHRISHMMSICFPDTAVEESLTNGVVGDFKKLPNPSQPQEVLFKSGQKQAYCEVQIIDDSLYEPLPPEEFHVTLATKEDGTFIDSMSQDCLVRILPDSKDCK